jgi:DNA-binding MarR family transcriptional regulator
MRPPYPVELVPLFPEFLTKRRTKMTFPLRAMDELGLDRPAYFWTINLSYRGAPGAAPEEGDLESPYSTIRQRWLPMAAAARSAGLAEERGGRWHLTAKGSDLARRQHLAAREHYRTLSPLPASELDKLARLLDRAFEATARADEPTHRTHTAWGFAYRGDNTDGGSFAQLDASVYGLWQVRDDCHISAWRAADFSGPDIEVLTRIWRGEASDQTALAALLSHQRPSDIDRSLERMRRDGLVEPEPPLRMTESGRKARQAVEDETDRLFFSPWPDDVGAAAGWIQEKLSAVNASF